MLTVSKQSLAALLVLALTVLCPAVHATEIAPEPQLGLTTEFSSRYANTIVNSNANRLTVTVANQEERPYVIDRIRGFLYNVYDHSKPLRTLEPARFTTKLPGQAEVVLPYKFITLTDVGDTALTLLVELSDKEGNKFSRVAFNETITVIDPSFGFDPQLWSIYIFGLALIGFAGYYGFVTYFAETKGKPNHPVVSKVAKSAAVKTQSATNDWIPEHHKTGPATRTRSAKKKSS
ncbi:Increased recombination centers protein 22 [Tieghemiomyces parasiticus]|uniref:Increased recombination centers protein 22 n=1 Tax=Tieghemiomyces parasiticus TaxID=78921 RepID=A0A9W8E1D1_9FUNG|nr:Increased recombination centers protein 22 [Tieghemiomyces parasiticus]